MFYIFIFNLYAWPLRSMHGLVFLLFKSLKGSGVIGPWFALGRSLFVKLLGRASFVFLLFVFLLINILLSFQ